MLAGDIHGRSQDEDIHVQPESTLVRVNVDLFQTPIAYSTPLTAVDPTLRSPIVLRLRHNTNCLRKKEPGCPIKYEQAL